MRVKKTVKQRFTSIAVRKAPAGRASHPHPNPSPLKGEGLSYHDTAPHQPHHYADEKKRPPKEPFCGRARVLTLQQLQHLLGPRVGLGQHGQTRLL